MLNMDFAQRVVIDTHHQQWCDSPLPGVQRKPLARQEAEQGHATSIVRYAPGAQFRTHDHPAGEEILVLSGVFCDHTGDYPAGTYFRNPPGFKHAPFSEKGCELLVKLHQFQAGDNQRVCIDTTTALWQAGQGNLQVLPLHQLGTESVALVRWPAGERFASHTHYGGEEIYVLQGEFIDEHGRYPAGTWLRSPHLSRHQPYVEQDTLIWVKVGHLA
ncbi:cupin domain-containing protein [Aliiglaciecola sp. CAU 1673]|uniref:cupin domain-containing protein n=1 Tax=Aliiglaciecola sp. CAU 1673 TaxID=3032595 RepID=UPI0023DBBE1E|nr:cupin domain-containing protein [Aliiglaciecola sp. CAU 1673]MDF2178093.1 cupin domain-containing protein [Aliiglaciecola sp. CAU 1673]